MINKPAIHGANPYMPLWEHVPDGEPRVFTYNGESRVYVYGSHDTEITAYCGRDYVVWSAPVTDLTSWTCHGPCYTATDGSILYAPDVVEKDGVFYMYAAEQCGSVIMVARSETPWGPFTDPVKTDLGFDPGILVDDDGRVYAYWGFCSSYCGELNDDMATIKEGSFHTHPIGHSFCPGFDCEVEHASKEEAFFEASSPRKILGKYVYLFSRRYEKPVPELGVFTDNNGFLSYRYSDSPLEGFVEGGNISFNGGEILLDENGVGTMTYQWGNNHGSLMEVNGHWYIFYHRQTGVNEYSRQAMLEPVEVAMDKDGRLFIGKITWEKGQPVACCPVEMTSQGPHIGGLDAFKRISAGYACHIYGGSTRAYVAPVYEKDDDISAPVTNLSGGATVGFRYLNFGPNAPKTVTASLTASAPVHVAVRLDTYDGREIAAFDCAEGTADITAPLTCGVIGKHAVYFAFSSKAEGPVVTFDCFTFD